MVDNATSLEFAIKDGQLPQRKTPDLCEIWTWQGDTSILPFKFESVLNSAATEPDYVGFGKNVFSHTELKATYIDNKGFDPNGFFFLTYRSQPIGLTLALPQTGDTWEVPFLAIVPNYYGKGVEQCLLHLVVEFLKSRGAKKAVFRVHPELRLQ